MRRLKLTWKKGVTVGQAEMKIRSSLRGIVRHRIAGNQTGIFPFYYAFIMEKEKQLHNSPHSNYIF